MITYDDFAKLDLRVGKILEVEAHPQADKLYLLRVDIGGEVRQLVAGIRPFYNPEALKDKLVAVVTNLEPKNIRGQVSEGMLLAASSDTTLSIVGPYEPIEVGSKIK